MEQPVTFEEDNPAKSDTLWSEEVEDEYSFDVQAYLSGVRSSGNSWDEGGNAFEDIDNYQSNSFRKRLGFLITVAGILLFMFWTMFDSDTPISAVNPEMVGTTPLADQQVASTTEEGNDKEDQSSQADPKDALELKTTKEEEKQEPTQADSTQNISEAILIETNEIKLVPQEEQDFFARLENEKKSSSIGWDDQEEICL